MKCILCDPGFCAVEDFKAKGVVLNMATCSRTEPDYGPEVARLAQDTDEDFDEEDD